jgi:hypothetical protein
LAEGCELVWSPPALAKPAINSIPATNTRILLISLPPPLVV